MLRAKYIRGALSRSRRASVKNQGETTGDETITLRESSCISTVIVIITRALAGFLGDVGPHLQHLHGGMGYLGGPIGTLRRAVQFHKKRYQSVSPRGGLGQTQTSRGSHWYRTGFSHPRVWSSRAPPPRLLGGMKREPWLGSKLIRLGEGEESTLGHYYIRGG